MTTDARVATMAGAQACPTRPILSLTAQRTLLRAWLILTDALALGAAFFAAYWVRFDFQLTIAPEVTPILPVYQTLAAGLTPLSILVFAAFRLYDPDRLLGGVSEYSRIFSACSTSTMIVVVATFLQPAFVVSRMWVLSAWLFCFLLVALNRFICRRMVYPMRTRGYFLAPAVIIGTNEEAATLASELSNWRASGTRIIGFVSTTPGATNHAGVRVLGTLDDIRQIAEQHDIEDVIVAITAVEREQLLTLCEAVNPLPAVHLRLSSGVYELLTTGLTVHTLGSVPLVSLNKVRLDPAEASIKNVTEYSLTVAGLLLIWPLLLAIAILIKLDSSGPVLHRRRVLGVSGRGFDAFKFRTMYVDGDAVLQANPELEAELRTNHKLKNDPRVTRVGLFLRKYSLDELPQLFNVLIGQMGLVGPRMISPKEVEKYGRHRLDLLTVKPGITGLWQVSGRSNLSYDERVSLDMYYIRNHSIWLDLQILFVQTLPAVVFGRGAY
jgi:exopolysaccharide biosynthesis polyprenyl glycosylphosphotransferase